ncbi:hypothetical protein ARTSIC4J27_618 [Pseudarthrobacter siccitolerans]|uniref:Uncharacterized protein n=1 Tax=Pseudarthrobacter siccitolerans TaxID=861266 RepID=A0A024GYW7_9MICC|nr:hypothetical protein ARTSIC4J27_618 [Pseudarthrobacter siccitolerans]
MSSTTNPWAALQEAFRRLAEALGAVPQISYSPKPLIHNGKKPRK